MSDTADGPILVDLSRVSLNELRAASTRAVLEQAEKPRTNLGGAGPPGRAD